jgi:hypothetical protein
VGSFRLVLPAAALAVTGSLLIACGGSGAPSLPSGTSTRSAIALPTLTATISVPTRAPAEPETPTETVAPPNPTRSLTRPEPPPPQTVATSEPPARPTAGSAITTPTSSATASPAAAEPAADTSDGIAWWWWLLAGVLIAGAVVIALVLRQRRRRTWRADLEAAEVDVAWFARELIPELRQAASLDQVVGGWAVASNRVSLLEDRLTALEATAGDDAGRTRARTLRDAVRTSRDRLNVLIAAGDVDALRRELDTVAADLGTVLWSRA